MSAYSRYTRKFDTILAMPLSLYLLLVIALLASVFIKVTIPNIRVAFSDPALLYAIRLSIITSLISTALCAVVAVPAGYVLSRRRFPGYLLVDTIVDMPIVLPPLVMGLCLLIFFNTSIGRWLDRGIVPSGIFIYQPAGIVLCQFATGCAYAIRVVKAGFDALDKRYEQVAMTLGARPHQVYFKIIMPNVWPSVVAGVVITWARIFGLFGPILLVAGTMRFRTEIMPTTIFLETSIGRIEVALVIGGAMILISLATLIIFKKLGGKAL
jgi:molybdate transport system permease protein